MKTMLWKANGVHRMLAILLAAILMVGLLPQSVFAGEEGAEPIDIKISYQADDSGFWIARHVFEVAPDLSEQYGYEDTYDGEQVTALDAIVAAHIAMFGDETGDINDALTVGDTGFITNFMGDGSGNLVYFVNSALPSVAAGETVLTDDDFVELFAIQDAFAFTDTRAWFEVGGLRTEAAVAEAGTPLELNISGTVFVIFGEEGAYEDVIEGAGIVPVTVEDGVAYFGEPLDITDEDGNASVTFSEPGTYILSAIDVDSDSEIPLMSPWLEVTVTAPDPAVVKAAAIQALLTNISNTYVGTGTDWNVMDMSAYGRLGDTNLASLRTSVDNVLNAQGNSSTNYERVAIALSSANIDASHYVKASGATVDIIDTIANLNSLGTINGYIYALLAYDSGDYVLKDGAVWTRAALIDYILAAQKADGGWALSGTSGDPDVTGMAISALASYRGQGNVADAIDNAVTYLSTVQKPEGGYASWGTVNSNSSSQVIIALAALDIDADQDARFIKNGKSVLDALLSYKTADDRFGMSNTTYNAMSTEQGFRALVAYTNWKTASEAYNVYRFDVDIATKFIMSYQADDSGFRIARREFVVTPGLSEEYGYIDAYNGTEVTALDAVVAAHIVVFGDGADDIHDVLTVEGSGFLSNFMGDGAGNLLYYVNHESPYFAAGETALADDDLVELFGLQDTLYWSDTYVWFVTDALRTETATVEAGTPLNLIIKGTFYETEDPWGSYEDSVAGAGIVPVTVNGGNGAASFGAPLAVTDAGGNASVTFNTTGTYILSAIDVASVSETPLLSPWLVVTVTGNNIYKIAFNPNGGSVTETSRSVAAGSAVGALSVPVRSGYRFEGWFTAANGGAKIAAGTVVNGAVTYYAHWTAVYKVTFDSRGGSAVAEKLVDQKKAIGDLATPNKTGYKFGGWYTKTSGGTKITAKTVPTKDVTYYAQWTAKSVKVTHDANKGKNLSVKTKTVTYDSKYGTLATTMRTGHTFNGWYTEKTGGAKVTKNTTVKNEKAHTLYAQWTANKYKATFDANRGKIPVDGGSAVRTKKVTVTYAAKFGDLPVPTRSGYEFKGWWTEKNGGTKITKNTKVTITKNTTYYAHWKKKSK
ncbi:MAG: InlB B-repeat-containing protein [Clostridiales Family XIII bacterium]|jgi:uncharacterized repeat protein (TIGR02543 family)|nr:InlB B-repeat-containing protein [Clostridiales Family XIII bacterium]